MKEQVSVDGMWTEGSDIKYLQNHIDKNWDNLADYALDSLVNKYNRLKQLDDNVKKKIVEYKAKEEAETNDGERKVACAKIWRVLERLDKQG